MDIKIELEQVGWGTWVASQVNGWDRTEVKDLDREQALLKLLAELGVEVTLKGAHWVNGERRDWQISNMKNT